MPIPKITPLQFFVLSELFKSEECGLMGHQIRDAMVRDGHQKSLSAFYQLMSRIGSRGLVRANTVHDTIEGIPVKQNRYFITRVGKELYHEGVEFYSDGYRCG